MNTDRFQPLSRESRRPARDFRAEQEERAIRDEADFDAQLQDMGVTREGEMPRVENDDIGSVRLLLDDPEPQSEVPAALPLRSVKP